MQRSEVVCSEQGVLTAETSSRRLAAPSESVRELVGAEYLAFREGWSLDAAGGECSNTPPAISKCGGEDTAEIGLLVDWTSMSPDAKVAWTDWQSMAVVLDGMKEGHQKHGEAGEWCEFTVFGVLLRVGPQGRRGGGGPGYRWCLEGGGVRLDIANRDRSVKETPNVWVSVGSNTLMRARGLEGVWAAVQRIVAGLGGVIVGNKLSRVDSCVDLIGEDIQVVTEAFRRREYVSRATKGSLHQDGLLPDGQTRWTGFVLGSGLQVRVYDKVREVVERQDEEKWATLVAERWEGEEPEAAVRVEFQLRRQHLKELGIEGVEDWFGQRGAIGAYLSERWFRMTVGAVDRTNTTRERVSDFWGRVQRAFAGVWNGVGVVVRTIQRQAVEKRTLVRQAAGCLLSAVAALGVECETDNRALTIMGCLLREDAKEGSGVESGLLGPFKRGRGLGLMERLRRKERDVDLRTPACAGGF